MDGHGLRVHGTVVQGGDSLSPVIRYVTDLHFLVLGHREHASFLLFGEVHVQERLVQAMSAGIVPQ